jgi:hypothetical protein
MPLPPLDLEFGAIPAARRTGTIYLLGSHVWGVGRCNQARAPMLLVCQRSSRPCPRPRAVVIAVEGWRAEAEGWRRNGAQSNSGLLLSHLQEPHRSTAAPRAASVRRALRFLHHNIPPGRLEMMMMACMMREMAKDLCSGTPTRSKKNT